MNAAFLVMTSTFMAGADPAPAATPPPPPPAVVSAGPGCNGPDCGGHAHYAAPCDGCGEKASKPGLFARLKAKFGSKKGECHDCAPPPCSNCGTVVHAPVVVHTPPPPPAPAPCHNCTPAPAPAPCHSCGSAPAKAGLFDRIKGRLCKKKADCGPTCDACAAPAGCGGAGCASDLPAGAAPVPSNPAPPPDTMPTPPAKKPEPKPEPKPKAPVSDAGLPAIPTPSGAVVIPSSPVTPVSGPKLNGTTNPY